MSENLSTWVKTFEHEWKPLNMRENLSTWVKTFQHELKSELIKIVHRSPPEEWKTWSEAYWQVWDQGRGAVSHLSCRMMTKSNFDLKLIKLQFMLLFTLRWFNISWKKTFPVGRQPFVSKSNSCENVRRPPIPTTNISSVTELFQQGKNVTFFLFSFLVGTIAFCPNNEFCNRKRMKVLFLRQLRCIESNGVVLC